MTTSNSIAVAGKVCAVVDSNIPHTEEKKYSRYKTNHTPEKLGALTASELAKLGVNDKEQRAQLLEAMKRFRGLATGAFIQPTSTGASTSERSTARGQVHDNKGDVEGEKDRMSREEGEKRQEKALDVEQRRQAALTALQEKFGKGGKVQPFLFLCFRDYLLFKTNHCMCRHHLYRRNASVDGTTTYCMTI